MSDSRSPTPDEVPSQRDRRSGADRRSRPRPEPGNAGQTVAQSLREAREQAGLSIPEVVAATHISYKQLSVLESGDFSQLHSMIFLKGYLRIVGDFLQLDSDELLARYEAELLASAPQDNADTEALPEPGSVEQYWLSLQRWFAGLPLLRLGAIAATPVMLAVLLLVSYYGIDDSLDELPGQSAGFVDAAMPDTLGPLASIAVSTDITDQPIAIAPSLSLVVDEPGQEGNAAAIVGQDAGLVAEIPQNNAAETLLAQNIADSTLAVTNSTLAATNSTPAVTSGMSSRGAAAQAASLRPSAAAMVAQHVPSDRLVIAVMEDSWVDIRDKQGTRLYRDLARAGNKIEVSGTLPFSLHVGNAPGLYLELNGVPFDIGDYRADNSARLTIAMQ